jgi:lysophospholipase
MAKRLLLLGLCCLLTACGPGRSSEAFVESRLPPGLGARFFPPNGWAWGLVQSGAFPAQRYGVSSPRNAPIAHILVLTGYGESAEVWFETASDLNDRGYAVWVLEGAGQGGSGRFTGPADIGHIPGIEADLQAIKGMIRASIPQDGKPVILLGNESGGIFALLSAARGLAGTRLILSSIQEPDSVTPIESSINRLGLGWVKDPRQPGWRRDGKPLPGTDPYRGRLQQQWQTANPDLRMAGSSIGRRVVMAEAFQNAQTALKRLKIPVLIINANSGFTADCAAAKNCRTLQLGPVPNRVSGHLMKDWARTQWLGTIDQFIREDSGIGIWSPPPPASDGP